MKTVTCLFIAALLLAQAAHTSSAWRDGDAIEVAGGRSWYPLGCPRLLTYWMKSPIISASKGFVGPSSLRSESGLAPTVTPDSTPSVEQIRVALDAQSRCVLPDPSVLAVTPEMRSNLIMIQHLARHMPARFMIEASFEERAIRALRRQGQFSLEDVFSQLCQNSSTRTFRESLARLTPGPAIGIDGLAWVPLLNPEGDISGPGLTFINDDTWRYNGLSYGIEGLRVRASKDSEEVRIGLNSRLPGSTEDYETYFARCPMPEAPEPLRWAKGYEVNPVPNFEMTDWEGDNLMGAVQRLGIERMVHADNATGSTELIYAEVQLRSLAFEDAPELGSALWQRRVVYAKQLIDSGLAKGADATRIAPLIRWLGNRHIVGEPGLKQDLREATRLLKIAAEFQDEEASEVYKSIDAGEIEICSDHMHLPDINLSRTSRPNAEVLQACE